MIATRIGLDETDGEASAREATTAPTAKSPTSGSTSFHLRCVNFINPPSLVSSSVPTLRQLVPCLSPPRTTSPRGGLGRRLFRANGDPRSAAAAPTQCRSRNPVPDAHQPVGGDDHD